MRDDRKAGILFLLAAAPSGVAALLADPQKSFNYVPAALFLLLGILRLRRSRDRR
ncbi:MAG TPA: hypothetical protein VEB59_01910 [Gemmatimonadales bacterium]|nr:hypothetical protein [Gemmatimonadales bacterium]